MISGMTKYKPFFGILTEQMPLLLNEGRIPITMAGLMRCFLDVLKSVEESGPKDRTPHALLLRAMCCNYFDTGDGAARHSDGRLKIVPNALYLRLLTPKALLTEGAINLTDEYEKLPGHEFSRLMVARHCGAPLSRDQAKKNPMWLALAGGDQKLLDAFTDARFSQALAHFKQERKMMAIYPPEQPEEGAQGRLFFLCSLTSDVDLSKADGNVRLDSHNGRLIGALQL